MWVGHDTVVSLVTPFLFFFGKGVTCTYRCLLNTQLVNSNRALNFRHKSSVATLK